MSLPYKPQGLSVIEVSFGAGQEGFSDRRLSVAYRDRAYHRVGMVVEIMRPRISDVDPGVEPDLREGILGGAIADRVAEGLAARRLVCLAGGHCCHATGVVGGIQDALGADTRLGLVWFDAHGDMNTPQTTLTGSLGGMPVAVITGLAWPRWREQSHIVAPLPCDRVLLVGPRNLDPPEAKLIDAVGMPVAKLGPGSRGMDLAQAVRALADRVDVIYLHIDADILDVSLVPNHPTGEPEGPDLAETLSAVEAVLSTGKVIAFALVSVFAQGEGSEVSIESGVQLLAGSLARWRQALEKSGLIR